MTPSEESWVARGLGSWALSISSLRSVSGLPQLLSLALLVTSPCNSQAERRERESEVREMGEIDLLTHGLVTVMSL